MISEVSLAKAVGERLGYGKQDVLVRNVTGRQIVKDATFKFLILDKADSELAFVLMSNDDYPDEVALAAEASKKACQIVGDDLADLIVVPSATGRIGNNSYAVFPYLSPLQSGRAGRLLARQKLAWKVCDWLERVAIKTMHPITGERLNEAVVQPLQWLGACSSIPENIQSDALLAIKALESGKWGPKAVFSHNDLWSGNVLIAPGLSKKLAPWGIGEPRIIDWLSSSEEGIPGYDLLNYANSTGYPLSKTAFS